MNLEPESPTVTVEVAAPASPPSEGEEAALEAVAEAVEEVSSDAVEIARIEADRDVTIAVVQAETTRELDANNTEIATAQIEVEQEQTTWQEQRIMDLETDLREVKERLARLSALPSSQPILTEALETAAEVAAEPMEPATTSLSILPDISEPIAETQTEVIAENDSGEVAEVIVRRRRRAI